MRITGAVLVLIAIVGLGFVAVSYQGQAVEDAAVANGTNASAAAYNVSQSVTNTVGQTLPTVAIYGGIAAMALTAAGLIVFYGPRGR